MRTGARCLKDSRFPSARQGRRPGWVSAAGRRNPPAQRRLEECHVRSPNAAEITLPRRPDAPQPGTLGAAIGRLTEPTDCSDGDRFPSNPQRLGNGPYLLTSQSGNGLS